MSTRRPKAPRKEPTQERAKETIRVLLEATDIVVREKGAAEASIAAIAERAGVAQGSVYQYFPTKAAVLAAWEEREWQRLAAEIGAEVMSLVERRPPIAEGARHLVRFASERIARQARVYAGGDSGFPDFVSRAAERKKILDGAIEAIAAALANAPESAKLRIDDPRRAAHVCVRLVMLLAPVAATPSFTPEQQSATLSDVEDLVMAFLFGASMREMREAVRDPG